MKKLNHAAKEMLCQLLKQLDQGCAKFGTVDGVALELEKIHADIPRGDNTIQFFSLAQFDCENGKRINAPKMSFIIMFHTLGHYLGAELVTIYPYSLAEDKTGILREGVRICGRDILIISREEQYRLTTFAESWLEHIKKQDFLKS